MYKVSSQLSCSYGPESKTGPDMPTVTVGDKRMTNVKMANGEIIQGIRRNKDVGLLQPSEDIMNCDVPGLRPLRYTPGLNCDAHLESLRPERSSNHPTLQGGDQWKKKDFRPSPNVEDKWYTSRLPDHGSEGLERLAMPASQYFGNTGSPYDSIYPQDELSQIKMRNRRFQNSCSSVPYAGEPMMREYPGYAPPTHQQEPSPLHDLSMLDQELNMTRRATRPFVPSEGADLSKLQRHLDELEEEQLKIQRKSSEPIYTVDQLPPPKKVVRAPLTEANAPKLRPEVRIADQIAIRSYVLGHNMSKIGGYVKVEGRPRAASSSRSYDKPSEDGDRAAHRRNPVSGSPNENISVADRILRRIWSGKPD
ncbi:unnamed protein product [Lepeophtheirus salmonis]|uniref:(salmon louse) hypothetical protein n=1 Tax=Lepeophtheirus salmonis TaxID=72036 RepID=A0A7R8CUH9_LEPSM|nr:unnamed protein product [Lepeophtheirus salmonis]CAF2935082.1 unnamed protein product [Lepeophtheirus salmonis]